MSANGTRPPKPPRRVTPELVRSALACIPPDVDRDTWARVGMAIKSEIDGDAGFSLWDEWSLRAESYDQRSACDTWRSIKAGGRTTIATLFGIAKDHGFRFPDDGVQAPAPTPEQLAEAERLAERRLQQREAEEADYRRRADQAARDARALWDRASEAGISPYLQRKGVGGHGVRYLADGTLVVPMRDAAGELQNVQRIASEKPEDGGTDKRYMPGGRKSGLWHLIGSVDTAPALLLGEGYATCATVHEATGLPIAVAFDAGNLLHVAKALRALHPALPLVVCGDDDRDTAVRRGKNPGREKAAAAARAVHSETAPAGVVFPEGLPDGGSDFNDLAAYAGTDAVRALVAPAAAAPALPKARRGGKSGAGGSNDGAGVPEPLPAPAKRHKSAGRSDGDGAGEADADAPGRDRFSSDESGVWYRPPASDDGTTASARRVCDRLEVLALARDMHDKGGALLLEFDSAFGKNRRWLMPLSMLAGDGTAYRSELLDMGFITPTDNNRRRWLTEYLQSRRPSDLVRLVDRVGWCGRSYVLPRETLRADDAEAGETIMFHSEAPAEDTFGRRGTLAQWRERIGRLCVGNSRLIFAASAALAGPVLAWVPGMESGGFHLRGDSSCGKTTALRVAASVFGGRDYLQRWHATDNGLEAQAAQHSDAILVLDELGQLDARVAGESAYMLANGQGKARAGRNGGARARLSWRLLWLSAGEIPLADHMAEAGKRIRAGQELRMVDMPADAGTGLGLFDTVHEFDGGAALSQHLAKACETTYGTLGRTWLEWLTQHSEEWPRQLREVVDTLSHEFVSGPADGQVQRAARRFALVAAAGELASAQGFSGWQAGEATKAARACFLAWIHARPAGWGSSERDQAWRQVRAWLEKNGDALLTWWHRATDDHKPNTALRAGFKRFVDAAGVPVKFDSATEYSDARAPEDRRSSDGALIEYLIFPEAFKAEICKGLDARFVARVLKEHGALRHDEGHDTFKHTVPGVGRTRMYHLLPAIFGTVEAE